MLPGVLPPGAADFPFFSLPESGQSSVRADGGMIVDQPIILRTTVKIPTYLV